MNPQTHRIWNGKAIAALALGVLLSGAPLLAQQDPQSQPAPSDQPAPPAQQQDQQGPPAPPPQDQQAQPAPPPQQDPQMPPQQPPDQQAGPQEQAPPPQPPPQANPPAERPAVPEALTLPAGTVIQVRTSDWLSSDKNHKGDQFIATLAQPIIADGFVVMRRGQTVIGQVSDAQKAGRVKGVSKLQLDLSQLTLVDGQLLTVQTSLLNASAGTSNGRDAAAVGLTTGGGAAIGAAAAGGSGAAIGAGAGFVAGIAGVLLTRGKPTIIPPEDVLTFRLETPVTISTVRGQMAYRPVTQQDYAQSQRPATRPRLARPYPPYGYYPYAYPCCGYYPYPAFYYGRGWGW
jgi:hypothetical protein